ncbi:hypothetical protein AAES_75727 [Amazona aestiva]|uniref:Uncharacterized protein n=1 Tax=Amazona aestiva TaxID=12930 RepID=A0A0Q3PLR9_AMAAE|nr:hypothetical protein AAES_75727 [Amazona aestiva]
MGTHSGQQQETQELLEEDEEDEEDDVEITEPPEEEKEEEEEAHWYEEDTDGIYDMMSSVVQDQMPTLIWTNQYNAVNYRQLQRDQMVNHFTCIRDFTTKPGDTRNVLLGMNTGGGIACSKWVEEVLVVAGKCVAPSVQLCCNSYMHFCSQPFYLHSLHCSSRHLCNDTNQKWWRLAVGWHSKLSHDLIWSSQQFKLYLQQAGHAEAWEKMTIPGTKEVAIVPLPPYLGLKLVVEGYLLIKLHLQEQQPEPRLLTFQPLVHLVVLKSIVVPKSPVMPKPPVVVPRPLMDTKPSPLLPWLQQELGQLLGNAQEAAAAQSFIISSLRYFGLDAGALIQLLQGSLGRHTRSFVQQLIDNVVNRCSGEARRRLGLEDTRATRRREDRPTVGPSPTAS